MQNAFLELLSAREGHFRLESGYHGDLWIDLDRLFMRPDGLQPFVTELARRLQAYPIEAVCGPLVGGALIAHGIAARLDVEFYYTERFVSPQPSSLYPVDYRLPASLRGPIRSKALAVVDDVINAGSAVRGTLAEVERHGAKIKCVGALLVLGDVGADYLRSRILPLERLADQASHVWLPSDCPLCRDGIPLTEPVGLV